MKILDDPSLISSIDKENMLKTTEQWPELLEEGYQLGKQATLPIHDDISTIIFMGMGGSAISGNFVSDIFGTSTKRAFITLRTYDLPRWVNRENSLVIALSYSGNTEETLSTAYQSLKKQIPCLFISSGGEMIRQAKRLNLPHLVVKGGLQPRAAFPLLFGTVLGALQANHLLSEDDNEFELDWEETLTTLRSVVKLNAPSTPESHNEAKSIANDLNQGLPIIFTAHEALGLRWRAQFNENAKILAQEMIFPEMCHNHVEAFENMLPIDIKGLILQTGTESNIIKQRIRITTDIIARHCQLQFRTVHGKGASNLAKFLSLVIIGDFTSIYLSILRKINPTPVNLIAMLKQRLEDETTFKKGLLHQYEQLQVPKS